jgi:micrococcal nuclease
MLKAQVFLFKFLFCFSATAVFANGGTPGKVISVVDGNTIEVLGSNHETYVIVLAGIDSPELTQEYGGQARKYLEKMILKKNVTVYFQGKDRKGNHLAVVMLKGEIDPRIALLKEGLAWTAEKDPLPALEVHLTSAREKGKGLWKEENPIPPWTYRRQQSMMQPKSS